MEHLGYIYLALNNEEAALSAEPETSLLDEDSTNSGVASIFRRPASSGKFPSSPTPRATAIAQPKLDGDRAQDFDLPWFSPSPYWHL